MELRPLGNVFCALFVVVTLGASSGSLAPIPELDGLAQVIESQATVARSLADVDLNSAFSSDRFADNARVLDAQVQWTRSLGSPGTALEPKAQPDGPTATCGPTTNRRESAVWGEFTTSGKRTPLFLTYDCRIRHEDGPESELLETPDSASFKMVCRDPVSGRDHAVFLTVAGASSSTIQVWGVDPVSAALKPLYTEWWGDMESHDTDRWGLDRLIAEDGTCLWRNRQEARATVKAAMVALRVRAEENVEPGWTFPVTLPTREIPAETARNWLRSLEGTASTAILEGAVYADDASRASWRVVQALSTTQYEWEGVILLLDRRAGTWQAIYDVSLDYPMLGMVVEGDHLFAAICVASCYDGHGYAGDAEYDTLAVDLRTMRATRFKSSSLGNNPPIHDVDEEILSQ